MNERIRELAEQAKFMTEEDINRQISYNTELKAFAEKFAELIILECAGITLDYKNHDHYMGWVDHGEEIIRQFGVER